MSDPNLILQFNDKGEIVRVHRGRPTVIAKLEGATLTWTNEEFQSKFRKPLDAFLSAEGIKVETTLLAGQKPDVVPADAPPAPAMHRMQGELTPKYLEWLMKWKPIAFQNLLGVELRALEAGEKAPSNPRDLWVRADVVRTDTRPTPESAGGTYVSTKFRMADQIIARRQSHLTFTRKEIYRGDTAAEQAEPFDDPHHPETLRRLATQGKAEIVNVKHAAATAGSNF